MTPRTRTLGRVARSGVEPLWPARLRWRMTGAWLLPAFLVLTPLEGLVLTRLPFYGTDGPGTFVAGVLVAGFLNLGLVAILAPLLARRLRRRRPDLPRVVAGDLAGSRLLLVGLLALVVAGMAHRPAVMDAERDLAAQYAAVHDYVVTQAPEYRPALPTLDAMRMEENLFRSCVASADPREWLCLFVETDQEPAGVRLDPDRAPNSVYRLHGGFD